MTKTRVSDNKKLGRPATGIGLLIGLRWHEPELALIDAWRREQDDRPSRGKAIHRLVQQALAASDTRPIAAASHDKAAELASHEIDKMGDQSATDDQRASRKRHLVKGPREFRGDRSKGLASKGGKAKG